jgi:purine nucleoside phosphorylase
VIGYVCAGARAVGPGEPPESAHRLAPAQQRAPVEEPAPAQQPPPAAEPAPAGEAAGRRSLLAVVAVADHANLTWRSPLTGPNDDSAGPRFPSMAGIYRPDIVASRLSAAEGMIVTTGVVAGVLAGEGLTAFEAEMVATQGYHAVSSELVPVSIVAAHMGLHIAAAVLVGVQTKEWDSGRP